MRSLMVVVSALAAFSAGAQEGKRTEVDASKSASMSERVERPVLVASRTNPPATADTRATAPARGGSPKAQAVGTPGDVLTAPLSSPFSMAPGSRSAHMRRHARHQPMDGRGHRSWPPRRAVGVCTFSGCGAIHANRGSSAKHE
jgi:hypothetical protein